ncbi:hypothetical protein AACH06_11030 [Ideonella sp. DXS29W]|uniref:Uncharacterized protein n=1 Tax=Ideonella lacteola TaxID=2984193 RepID=A0ABU9BNK2_9BURK
MNTLLIFASSLTLAVCLPIVAVRYLEPILAKVLRGLCDADGGAEFWIRSAYLLAVTGTVVLQLTFGRFEDGADPVDVLRRTLWLVLAGIFVTVAFIASRVWHQVSQMMRIDVRLPMAPAERARATAAEAASAS